MASTNRNIEPATGNLQVLRLLQLASPALPVGAYSYSQGLESAADAGVVTDAESAQRWIGDLLEHSLARMEGPIFLRLYDAWKRGDVASAADWNMRFLASRESAELRAETVQMGYSLRALLEKLLDLVGLRTLTEVAFPTAFAYAAAAWGIPQADGFTGYIWAWVENQVLAAIKIVPLGQTEGQRMLLALAESVEGAAKIAMTLDDESVGALVPRLALLSARHETQYSRLFRS
jgi:urease accessory protein